MVKPGAVLCVVGEGAGAAASAPSPATPAAGAPLATSTSSSHGARQPSIHFPPRRLADGRRISDLPVAEADAAVALLWGAAPAATEAAPSPAAAAPPPPAAPAAPQWTPPPPPPKPKVPNPAVVTTFLNHVPPRRTLTQREIDFINSGGAF